MHALALGLRLRTTRLAERKLRPEIGGCYQPCQSEEHESIVIRDQKRSPPRVANALGFRASDLLRSETGLFPSEESN